LRRLLVEELAAPMLGMFSVHVFNS
jgi:hypothetical protein